MGNYNVSLPYVGAMIDDGRVFCPMFAERQEARQQVGRRQQKFLGPSVLRAISLPTGEAIWDTETVEVTVRGAKVPLLEYLNLDKSDFCFGGPPVVRGDLPVRGRPEDDVRDAERSRQELHVRQHVALALRQDAGRRLEVGGRFRQDHDLVT